MKIGVLALQGTFVEHVQSVLRLGAEAIEVRRPEQLHGVSGVIIPGGESTTLTHLIHYYGLVEPLRQMAACGTAFLGTCAGMICMARDAGGSLAYPALEIMDIKVKRNAFGRQRQSFEQFLDVPVLGDQPFPGLFIRGPVIEQTGREVQALAWLNDGALVAAQQENLLVTSFHPELMDDLRFHQYFLALAASSGQKADTIECFTQ